MVQANFAGIPVVTNHLYGTYKEILRELLFS